MLRTLSQKCCPNLTLPSFGGAGEALQPRFLLLWRGRGRLPLFAFPPFGRVRVGSLCSLSLLWEGRGGYLKGPGGCLGGLEWVLLFPNPLLQHHSILLFEAASEVVWRVKTHHCGKFTNGNIGLFQGNLAGFFHAHGIDKARDTLAGQGPQLVVKGRFADTHGPCKGRTVVIRVGKMRLYAIHSRLQEPTVWAAVVFIFYLEVCLCTEFLLDTLAVFDDTVNAQLQVFQLKRLRDIGIYADAIGSMRSLSCIFAVSITKGSIAKSLSFFTVFTSS